MFWNRPLAFPTGLSIPRGKGLDAVASGGVMPSALRGRLVTDVKPYVPRCEAPVPDGMAYGAQKTANPPRSTVLASRL